jgi:DNA-binding GntR family transcriptional regulator
MNANLKQTAYDHVCAKLLRGDLRAGARLSTLALARELDISNMPVREALNQLHAEGLVDRRPHAGCTVRKMDATELTELYALRAILESYAAEECARHITSKGIDELEKICDEMHRLAQAARTAEPKDELDLILKINETDIHFHQALIRSSGNRWVEQTASKIVLLARIMRAQIISKVANIRWLTARHYRLHTTIVRVIRSGDAKAARDLLEAHVLSGNPLNRIKPLEFPGGIATDNGTADNEASGNGTKR